MFAILWVQNIESLLYFLIEDDELLEKYNTIWDKLSADIKKEFNNNPVYNFFFFFFFFLKNQTKIVQR